MVWILSLYVWWKSSARWYVAGPNQRWLQLWVRSVFLREVLKVLEKLISYIHSSLHLGVNSVLTLYYYLLFMFVIDLHQDQGRENMIFLLLEWGCGILSCSISIWNCLRTSSVVQNEESGSHIQFQLSWFIAHV